LPFWATKSNVASTLLLVWTVLKKGKKAPRPQASNEYDIS